MIAGHKPPNLPGIRGAPSMLVEVGQLLLKE